MNPLRKEDITLFCEDRPGGVSAKLIEAALQDIKKEPGFGFAASIAPSGCMAKNDVQVWTKFARRQSYQVFGVRDRDFLTQVLVDTYRGDAFHKDPNHIRPWPLPRHCIESYLLDDDVLSVAVPGVPADALRAIVDDAASARKWLDVARGTVEDFLWRWRNADRRPIVGRPSDRPSALSATLEVASSVREASIRLVTEEELSKKVDELVADMDMKTNGPLRHRVDGRELVDDVRVALESAYPAHAPPGGLLSVLKTIAQRHPPAALLVDLGDVLKSVPQQWRGR